MLRTLTLLVAFSMGFPSSRAEVPRSAELLVPTHHQQVRLFRNQLEDWTRKLVMLQKKLDKERKGTSSYKSLHRAVVFIDLELSAAKVDFRDFQLEQDRSTRAQLRARVDTSLARMSEVYSTISPLIEQSEAEWY